MPKQTNYAKGRAAEYEAQTLLSADFGCTLVFRSAGSKGPFDLIGVNPYGQFYLVQVKTAPKMMTDKARQKIGDEMLPFIPEHTHAYIWIKVARRGWTVYRVSAGTRRAVVVFDCELEIPKRKAPANGR